LEPNRQFSPEPIEARLYPRYAITLTGSIFLPVEDVALPCRVLNLSGGGAGIRCEEPPPLNAFVVLYIDGFGRFEGVTTRYELGELGMRFVCKEAKRQRLLADILRYVQDGAVLPTQARRHARSPSSESGQFTRANGETVRCDVLDVSLQGLSLRTNVRPPVGELINLGKTFGRVVRHHADGISVQFVDGSGSVHGG
jgi:hypothetical protein